MISAADLRNCVIVPTLMMMSRTNKGMYAPAAVNLLLGTAAHESLGGFHLRQINGPALGIYQVEPATHDDLWENYLAHRPDLAKAVRSLAIDCEPMSAQLQGNLYYATAIARLVYWRRPEPLPDKDDIEGQARYWKAHYNTDKGRGSVAAYLENANNILSAML